MKITPTWFLAVMLAVGSLGLTATTSLSAQTNTTESVTDSRYQNEHNHNEDDNTFEEEREEIIRDLQDVINEYWD